MGKALCVIDRPMAAVCTARGRGRGRVQVGVTTRCSGMGGGDGRRGESDRDGWAAGYLDGGIYGKWRVITMDPNLCYSDNSASE